MTSGQGADADAEGWYEDPYHLHQHRWFSAGNPTSLVKDDGVEAQDAPPDEPPTEPLLRSVSDSTVSDGGDLHRADEAQGSSATWGKTWDVARSATDAMGLRFKK